jgi:hypothetical protein
LTGAIAEGASIAGPLAQRYEELREEVVSGTRGRSLGHALFLREGMTGWMRACSTWMPAPLRPSRPHRSATVPVGLREPMATLLADMVLSTAREAAS